MPENFSTPLLVSGSISLRLMPAALVWPMRTVAAASEIGSSDEATPRAAQRPAAVTKGLVFIATHFKLRSHVVDPLFHRVGSGGARGTGLIRPRFRRLQDQNRAAVSRK